MKTKIIQFIIMACLIIGVSAAGYLGYKTYSADTFCRDKGYDSGHYKAIDGGYYRCGKYMKFNLESNLNEQD
jgi:hypothetical protein